MLDGIEEVVCGPFGRVQVGLHLTLSGEKPLGEMRRLGGDGRLPGPDALLLLALTGRLDKREIEAEIDRQFEAFRSVHGRTPDFVDAHQHVHVYPTIRSLVASAVRRHAHDAWVRVPGDRLSPMLRRPFRGKALGSTLHAVGFRKMLARHGLRANDSFAGHYDFGPRYEERLRRFFDRPSHAHLIMCHPGADDIAGDLIARARVNEAEVIGKMTLEERVARYSRD